MRDADREFLAEMLGPTPPRDLTRSDLQAILVQLRDAAPKHSIVRDAGDSVAHEQRDRGPTHQYTQRFVAELIEVLRVGGVLNIQTAFEIHTFIDELVDVAKTLDIDLDRPALHARSDDLGARLASVLDGTTIRTTTSPPTVVTLNGGDSPTLTVRFTEPFDSWVPPNGRWDPRVPFGTPLIKDTT